MSGIGGRTRPAAAALVLLLSVTALPALAQQPRVTIAQGALTGAVDNGVSVFRGVPYAAAPIGARRWAPPAAPVSWGASARDATRFGAGCPQALAPYGRLPWTVEYMHPVSDGLSEDCLFLNVWTPDASASAEAPVLVFFHGGGNVEGSGSAPIYDGANLARKGIVVVNLNYRLGPFGYLAHPGLSAEQGGTSGNYGLLDQQAALRWVRDNIRAFGGDPAKVTIAGQSAGASNVMGHLVAPGSKGLFRAAIIQSGGGLISGAPRTPLAEAEKTGAEALRRAGAETIAQARALPTDQVWHSEFRGGLTGDGKILPTGPTVVNADVPLLVGYTLHDNTSGGKRQVTAAAWKADVAARYGTSADALLKLLPGDSDAQATRSANAEVSERLYFEPLMKWRAGARGGRPVYAYRFTHPEAGPQSDRWGAFHSAELPYVFNTLHLSPNRAFTAVDRKVAEDASAYWANFVKTGDPNGAGLPAWPALTAQDGMIMALGGKSQATPAVSPALAPLYASSQPPAARP